MKKYVFLIFATLLLFSFSVPSIFAAVHTSFQRLPSFSKLVSLSRFRVLILTQEIPLRMGFFSK